MKCVYMFFIGILFLGALIIGCSGENNEVYIAEKMFYKAEKIKQHILMNPDIASPEEYIRAENVYREIIETFNKNNNKKIKIILRRTWLTVAELYLIQKKFEAAVNVYKEIIEKSVNDKELCAVAQFSIARCYEQTNRLEDATKCYQDVFKNYPPVLSDTLLPNYKILQTPIYVARLYRQKGDNFLADRQYNEARRYYNEVITKWPNSEVALAAENQIATSYGDQGMWDKSVEILNNIIYNYQSKKEIPDVMYTLGQVYQIKLNQLDKALEVYQQIIQKYPQDKNLGKVYLAIGSIHLIKNNYNKARDEFKYMIDNYQEDENSCVSAQLAIAKSYELENNWNKALNEYQWVINNYPKNIKSLNVPLYIADHYEKQQQHDLARNAYESAIKQYQQLIEKYPNTILAAMALDFAAASYIKLEKWEEAANAFNSLLEMEIPPQKRINTYLTLENIYEEKLHDTEKALETYAALLERYPKISNASSISAKAQQLQQELNSYKLNNQPPVASDIVVTNLLSTSSVAIQWKLSNEYDFDHYQLIRSEAPNVNLNDKTIAEILKKEQVEFIDNDVKEGGTYYYRLFTFDKGGLHSGSKEVSIKVEAKEIVGTVNLLAKSDNWSAVYLKWNSYNGNDFDSYKIYRSSTPGVSLASQLVKSVFGQQITQLEDNDLKENTTYYYKVYVYNSGGANKPSNEVKVTTLTNTAPNSIKLYNPLTVDRTSVELSWSPSNDNDFSMYRIYRSESLPVSLERAPIYMNSNRAMNKYKDTGLTVGKTYYYKVVVYDKGGLYSESNEVSINP